MKNNIEEIDMLIKEALHEDDAQIYDELGEQDVFEMLFGLFQGKKRWYMWVTSGASLLMMGFAIYCFILFGQAETTKEMLTWGGIGFFLLMGVSFVKVFHWLQMDKNALIREMKRMELQIASLHNQLQQQKN